MKYKNGEEFLNKLYREMYISNEVMHKADPSDAPEERIRKYISRLEHAHELSKKSEHSLKILKKFYYDKYLIKELPESYINLQNKIAREEGYGDIYVSDETIETMLNQVREDQKSILDLWIDYFMSEDAMYPTWFKVYAFKGMIGLSTFDKEKQEFGKRTDKTTTPFIDLNMEALSKVYDILKSEIGEDNLTNEEREILSNGEGFKKLYTYYLINLDSKIMNNDETEGIWIKYDMGSDYISLWESLQGKNTGWCTAGKETAKTQLAGGDFYVYYTKDENGEYKNPRIAIRMNGENEIGEIRGTSKNQNLEPNMEPILNKKLEEFPDKDKYKKKVHDMKRLTLIEEKQKNNQELTLDDLKFLYEVDSRIEGFGYQKDPRIKEIISKRDKRKDIVFAYGVNEDEIAFSKEEWEENKDRIKVYYGNLDLSNLTSAEGLVLPDIINGSLDLRGLTTAKGLVLPDTINGFLDLRGLTSVKNVKLPTAVNGNLNLGNLTSVEGLILPTTVNGNLDLPRLTNAEGLVLPNTINGYIDLRNLTSAKGLVLPNTLNGDLYLTSLTSAEGLKFPNTINGFLDLGSLTSVKDVKFPNTINGFLDLGSLTSAKGLELPNIITEYLDLGSLTSAEGLVLPNTINEHLNLRNLTSAKGLVLPNTINGSLDLSSLTSAEGLALPDTINGYLDLSSLTSAEGLVLPNTIGGSLSLSGLKSAKGLVLPDIINGSLYLTSLTSAEGLVLPDTINEGLDLGSLTSAEDLALPDTINDNLDLGSLTSAEGLVLPNIIGGSLHLTSLTSAKDLVLPDTINGNLDLRGLTSVEGLVLPDTISGSLHLTSLTSAKGLRLSNIIYGDLYLEGLTSVEGLVLPISLFNRVHSKITIPETCFIPDEEYYKYINEEKNSYDNCSVKKYKMML
jgi:hypothetical protein